MPATHAAKWAGWRPGRRLAAAQRTLGAGQGPYLGQANAKRKARAHAAAKLTSLTARAGLTSLHRAGCATWGLGRTGDTGAPQASREMCRRERAEGALCVRADLDGPTSVVGPIHQDAQQAESESVQVNQLTTTYRFQTAPIQISQAHAPEPQLDHRPT